MNSTLAVVPVAILVISSYVVPLLRRLGQTVITVFTAVCLATVTGISLYMFQLAAAGTSISYHAGGWGPPFGIEIWIGPFEAYMLATIGIVGSLIAIWSVIGLKTELHDRAFPFYCSVYLLVMAGMMGMAMAADLFNMYVFLEVTGIAACALVAAKSTRASTLAAFKYLLLNAIGSAFVLFAIGLIYMVTGNLNYSYVRQELLTAWSIYPNLLWVAVCFFIAGFGIKAALFPLHIWLPDAHSTASSPASAALSGLVVKIYAFTMIKILYLLVVGVGSSAIWDPIRTVLIVMAVGAILGGSGFALVQREVKRLLAYSTVAQMGYIFLGLGIGTAPAMTAAVFHILGHAVMKACLFLSAGMIYTQTGAKKISEYDGMGRRMPVAMAAFSIAALSMMGMPGFVGLITKWYLAVGAMTAGMSWLALVMVLSGILNAFYYLPILERAYFRKPAQEPTICHPLQSLPVAILATLCVVLGLVPQRLLSLITRFMPFIGP